ncbi:11269_t:CDS:2 [Racocetra fulgida]|uniref:11269_t:CDS:1 n=1 Tax=Racocetra fulgida TaxID=60492 RepID=A0A9N8ZFG9_9GLOM|nr:11269_t:CDS:2 [Racocetra fulgida]
MNYADRTSKLGSKSKVEIKTNRIEERSDKFSNEGTLLELSKSIAKKDEDKMFSYHQKLDNITYKHVDLSSANKTYSLRYHYKDRAESVME